MLRVWVTISLLMVMVFTGIGLVVSKAWGWSEYASDEVYLIAMNTYYYDVHPSPLVLLSANGDGQTWSFAQFYRGVKNFSCSPNGQVFAVTTDEGILHVMDRSGVRYERSINLVTLGGFSVNNDGTVTTLKERFINADKSEPVSLPPDPNYNHVISASSGLALWSGDAPESLEVTTANGQVLWTIASAYQPIWLPSEALFAFIYSPGSDEHYREYLADPQQQRLFQIPFKTRFSNIFTPDATKKVVDTGHVVYLGNVVSDGDQQAVATEGKALYWPYCFLTFRPKLVLPGG
nr:hypothetical protein [uncultured bacterium]